ncbi:amino acid ABC transporter permease [Arthrobacter sp. CAU 1506]|uniref:amino acid ABC transporter permease n=1 Tax=Arthrobacter sp. CAU 1506 TaxID=2560052 RepID=UPI0010AC414E|nr:amino acid ABC transporter permease [Arthrobacter sp. CAU 1506]TJY70782.1 amino acid ABC transporter permease [Arthrobacter sp. CAU 1506]
MPASSAGTSQVGDKQAPELPLNARRPPAWGRWIGGTAAGIFGVWVLYILVVTPNIHWDVVAAYIASGPILEGLWITIALSVISMAAGTVIGLVVAIMQLSQNPVLRIVAGGFSWFFRGTPLLVQLLFWFNLGVIFPRLEFGIPFGGPKLFGVEASIITPFIAGLLGLAINEGAYMSQIIRAGILSVDNGQREAAEAMGMSRAGIMGRIILPQAMRFILPPTGNQFISMLKTSSLVSIIAGSDLMTVVQRIYLGNFEVISMLIVASIWYLILTSVATVGQHFLEKKYSKGFDGRTSVRSKVLSNLAPISRRKPGFDD